MASGFYIGHVHTMLDKRQSFEQFVWSVARGFGAFLPLRDDPHLPTPLSFSVSAYYEEQLQARTAAYEEWSSFDEDARREWALQRREELRTQYVSAIETINAEARAIDEMWVKVTEWRVPTPEHQNLKDTLIQYLADSRKETRTSFFDERLAALEAHPLSVLTQEHEGDLLRELEYSRRALDDEKKRVEERNAWIKALNESVPLPKSETEDGS